VDPYYQWQNIDQ